MPRPIAITNAFTSGELSPGAYGRVDLDKYAAGLTCCMNYLIDPLGGIKRRPGTRFVCETKLSQFSSRLFPFQFSVTQAYMIEAGCQYLRFYNSNAIINLSAGANELIVNGNFSADITSWTTAVTGTGVAQWSGVGGGSMLLTQGASGTANARQDVTVVSGQTYTVKFIGLGNFNVTVGSTSGGSDLYNAAATLSLETHLITATSTTMSIKFTATSTLSGYIDKVSIQTGNPLEVTTPYLYSDLADVDVVQSADEQYWLHACTITRKLQRYSDSCWRFNCVPFSPPPSIEYGARPGFEMQPSALTGASVTVTAFNHGGGGFLNADKDREIQITSGTNAGARAGIVSVTSTSAVVAFVCVPFLDTSVNCTGTWKLSGSPLTTVRQTDNGPVGKPSNLTLGATGWRQGGSVRGETDIGKFVHLQGGVVEITCIPSTTVAYGIIRSEIDNNSAAITTSETGTWSLEEPLWSCIRGYASTGDFFEDRLWLDGGFRFVGSKTSDYENMASGVADDDAVAFAINSKTINAIRGIIGARQLQLFTTGGEFIALGGTDSPITPTNIRLSNETTHGSSGVTPIRVGDVTLFLTRFGKQLREFTQRADVVSDAFVAPDLLLLASHLTQSNGIIEMAYQREPTSTIWAVRSDGTLLSCAYRREENVVAWAQHSTCGSFESVGVIPHPDGDREQVWFIVNRGTINGATRRYVEYLDDSTLIYDRRLTDSAVIYNNCVAISVFTGLDHLECQTVQIQADGEYRGTCVVAQGRVGIATPASRVEIGLPYVSEAITLTPEIATGAGSIQPQKKEWTRVFVRVKDSCNMMVRTAQGQLEFIRDARGNVMNGSGVKDYDTPRLGDYNDARVTIRQEQPLPSHLLMVGGVLNVGDA